MKIIIGLGNPDDKYKLSRHNLGFLALDWINKNVSWQYNKKFNSLVFSHEDKLFVKPQTYMNNSGLAVARILHYYHLLEKKMALFTRKNIDLKNTLYLIHDDLDINTGETKISFNSSSAGHKGVESVIREIKTQNFTRLRLGIKSDTKPPQMPTVNYVLQTLEEKELEFIKKSFLHAWRELEKNL